MVKRMWTARAVIAFAAAAGVLVILAQACGGSSAGVEATPTAKPLPTVTPGDETPASRPCFGPRGEGDGPVGWQDVIRLLLPTPVGPKNSIRMTVIRADGVPRPAK